MKSGKVGCGGLLNMQIENPIVMDKLKYFHVDKKEKEIGSAFKQDFKRIKWTR